MESHQYKASNHQTTQIWNMQIHIMQRPAQMLASTYCEHGFKPFERSLFHLFPLSPTRQSMDLEHRSDLKGMNEKTMFKGKFWSVFTSERHLDTRHTKVKYHKITWTLRKNDQQVVLVNSWMSFGPLGRTRLLAVFVNVPLESAVS